MPKASILYFSTQRGTRCALCFQRVIYRLQLYDHWFRSISNWSHPARCDFDKTGSLHSIDWIYIIVRRAWDREPDRIPKCPWVHLSWLPWVRSRWCRRTRESQGFHCRSGEEGTNERSIARYLVCLWDPRKIEPSLMCIGQVLPSDQWRSTIDRSGDEFVSEWHRKRFVSVEIRQCDNVAHS